MSSLGLLRTAALAAALATTARAGIFVTHLGEDSNPTHFVDSTGTAGSFTTGNFAYTLDSATLRLTGENSSPGDGTITYQAFLYSDAGGGPGSPLYALGSHTDTSGSIFIASDRPFSAPVCNRPGSPLR